MTIWNKQGRNGGLFIPPILPFIIDDNSVKIYRQVHYNKATTGKNIKTKLISSIFAVKSVVVALLIPLFSLLQGCLIGETGSRTVVGNHFALPKLSSVAGDIELNIYESTEGAVVTTRKDCAVEISYLNTYTNNFLGVYEKIGSMALAVKISPTVDEKENK